MRDLSSGHQADFLRIGELLYRYGPQEVGMPHVRPLGDKLWEMRLRDASGIARAIYFTTSGRRIVVLHAFEKRTQKSPGGPLIWRSGGCRSFSTVTQSFDDLKAELLRDPTVRAEYDARAEEFEIASELIAARLRAGLSQEQLARRMGISQSAVARIESGRHWPSRATLQRYAKATGARPVVRLVPPEAK